MLHPEVSCRLTGPKGLRVGTMVDISPVDGAWRIRDLGGDGSARVGTISRVTRIRDDVPVGCGASRSVRGPPSSVCCWPWSREIKEKRKKREQARSRSRNEGEREKSGGSGLWNGTVRNGTD